MLHSNYTTTEDKIVFIHPLEKLQEDWTTCDAKQDGAEAPIRLWGKWVLPPSPCRVEVPRQDGTALPCTRLNQVPSPGGCITGDTCPTSAVMPGSLLGQGAEPGDCNAASCNHRYLLANITLESKTIPKCSSRPPAAAAPTWASSAQGELWVLSVPASFSTSQVVTLRSLQPRQGNHPSVLGDDSSEPLHTPKDEGNCCPEAPTSLLWLQREQSSHTDMYLWPDESLLMHFYSARWDAAVVQG